MIQRMFKLMSADYCQIWSSLNPIQSGKIEFLTVWESNNVCVGWFITSARVSLLGSVLEYD